MQVLHVVTRDCRRGAETTAQVLQAAFAERGVGGQVVALAPAPPGQPPLGVPVLGPTPLSMRSLARLRRLAANHDVVVAHGSSGLPACGLALAGTGVPFIYRNIGVPRAWSGSPVRRLRVTAMLRRAAAVAAISDGAREELLTWLGLPADRVKVIGAGTDTERFCPATGRQRATHRTTYGLPAGAPVVAVVGALAPEKRMDLAIEAVARVDGARLLVAGDGPLRRPLEALAAETLPGRAQFLGVLADVRPVLHASDVLLMTSRTEGLPAALIEAGLCGLPVVSTNVGYVAEVVLDGVTGRLVDGAHPRELADAIVEVLKTPTMGGAALKHCQKHFALNQVVDRWLSILREVTRVPATPW